MVWYNSLTSADEHLSPEPWQVINRIDGMNLICRKAALVRMIHRIQPYFTELYDFLPESYVLPNQEKLFAGRSSQERFIVKGDRGALGNGIQFVAPGAQFSSPSLSVAQAYINSYLLNGYKFDLRVYVLVLATRPRLSVYVYRDGIVRMCSEPASEKGPYSELTNTAVNIRNPKVTADRITRMISDVFQILSDSGKDVDQLWADIDRVIALTVLSASQYLGDSRMPRKARFPTPYQLLGFDILLDEHLKPWLLEVNYRPSLEYGTESEKSLKIAMLKDLVSIAAPLDDLERLVRSQRRTLTECPDVPEIKRTVEQRRNAALAQSKFVMILPSSAHNWPDLETALAKMADPVDEADELPSLTRITLPRKQKCPKNQVVIVKPIAPHRRLNRK
jgi:hypothetical protein